MKIRAGRKGMAKRLIALLTTMSMTMGIIPAFYLNVLAAGEFSGGSGTAADPYIIETAADLKALADKVNAGEESYATAYYKIPTETYTYTKSGVEYTDGVRAVSIDLSEYDPWTPIGTEAHPFKGHFNGSSNENKGNGSYGTINNAHLQIAKDDYSGTVQTAGIFGYVDGATIENVAAASPQIGAININAHSSGDTAYHCIGGLIGFAKDSTIRYCTTYTSINLKAVMGSAGEKKTELYVGGVIGAESGSEIFRCVNNSSVDVRCTEDDFEGNDSVTGKKFPDMFAGGIAGGVIGISENASKIHGSENMSEIVISIPRLKNADNIRLYSGGIVGGISGLQKDMLELCQDYNRSSGARARVTNSEGDPLKVSNVVACAGGIFGYDDVEKKVHVHDCKNDAGITNAILLTSDSENSKLYSGGIVAGRGNVDNCLNIAMVQSMQPALSSGICYSVPHHCYSTGMVPGAGQPICVEVPEDTTNYYNYFTNGYNGQERHHPTWQYYMTDTQLINNGGLTWLLQGDQDPNYLHWTATNGSPLLGGGYYVKTGGRPLDYWLNKGWGAYNNDMGREIVAFAPAWSYRIRKYRYVTTGEGNDGVDPTTKEDLKSDTSFASFEKSSTDQFYAIGYGYYCGRIGALPMVNDTDEKTFIQWQATPAATEGAAVNLGSAFTYSGANSTVYAVARVKFGAKDDDGVYRSVYGDGNTIDNLNNDVNYGTEPDTTAGKFTYTLSDVTTEGDVIENAEQYFTIDGEKLKVAENTPVGVYTVGISAAEKSPVYTLLSASLGFDAVNFTLTAEVVKADPGYTEPAAKQRVYDGKEDDVITAGSTADGKILYTLTPADDTSWSEEVPKASELGLYTIYWKIEGDSNHNDKSPSVVSGLIYPDSSDPANAIIVTPTADWTYDGNTYPLATVTKPDFAEIEWSSNNTDWTAVLPTAVNAGSYPVYWRVKTNDYNIDDHGSFTVKVSKATLTITPPVGLTKKYTGDAQELITAGSAAPAGKGTMKYSLSPELNNWSDSNWQDEIPTRTNAGDYKVYYRVFPSDLDNYNDTFDKANPTSVNAAITKLTKADLGDSLNVVPTPDWTYDGSTRKLVNETETKVPTDKGLKLMYSTDGEKWTYTIPTGTDVADYKVKWKTVGNNNIDEVSGEFIVRVSKKKPSIVIEKQPDWQYDGKSYQLVTIKENNDNLRFTYSVNGGEAQTTVPSAKDAGTYKVSVTSQPNNNYETYQGSFEIKCTPVQTTGSVNANTLTFNYGVQELIAPNDDVTNGRLMYKVEGESVYSDVIPQRRDAGTYKVWYYVKGTDSNYEDTAEQSVDVTIAKFDPNPTVHKSENLEYNKNAQTLLTVDTAEHRGMVKYAVKKDGSAPSDSDWTTEIPKATNAGSYNVYWKVFDDSGRDDGEKNLVEPDGMETVSIAKYNATIAYVHAEDLPYNGKAQELVEEIKARNDMGTVKYAVTASSVTQAPADGWSDEIPTGTNAGTYKVWFKIVGDDNINDVDPQGADVTITKAVPKISVIVKSALKYNGNEQDLVVRPAAVDAGAGDGTLKFAVTDTAGATPADSDWSENYPQRKDGGKYYVWYRFDGDDNTESVAAKKATSVISADIPEVAVSGKHLDYTGTAQELIEGEVDGAAIKNNTQVKYYVSENENETFNDTDAAAWSTDFPSRTDAKKYYVWYYVPESGSNIAVGPSMVEAEIRKGSAIPYDFGSEDPVLLAPDGQSFTVPYGTKLGDITLHDSPNGKYAWHDYVKDRVLSTIGTYNYPANFTDRSGNYESGTVQIAVTITKIPEPTPNIGIDYINEKLTGFDPSKTYTIWDGEHTDSTTRTIPEERMTGDDVKYPIVLKASTDHTTDSEAQKLTIPTRPPAPKLKADNGELEVHQPAYLTASGRIDGITADMEYSVGDSGTWITGSNKELTIPQNTKVYVRYKAVADVKFKSFPCEINITESQRTKVTMNDAEVGINFINHTLIPEPGVLEPNTKYTVTIINEDGTEGQKYRAETDANGEFPIEEEWHEQRVKIVKSGDILYTVDSEPKYKDIPARPAPPDPKSKDSKITNVLNVATETDEYRLTTAATYKDVENADSTDEVEPDKYVVRVKATATSFASLDTPVIVKEKTPNADIDYVKETLNNLLPNTEYIITELDDNENPVAIVNVITDANGEIPIKESWFGTRNDDGTETYKKLHIQKKGKSEEFNSDPQKLDVPARPEKPEPKGSYSKIIEVNNTMEYRLASTSGSGSYTLIDDNANEIDDVTPDSYEVRYRAVAGESFASLPATVKVEPMPTPEGHIDYKEVKIKDLEPEAEYTVIDEDGNEETVTTDVKGKIPIKEEWMGTDIEIIRNGDDATEDSEPQTINIPKRPDPPHPSSKDGKITEVDDTMEYRPKDDTDDKYVPVEDGKTESPVVPSGEYAVRYEATPTSFPSLPAYVTVTSPQNPTAPAASNHTSNTSSGSKAAPTPSPSSSNGTGGNNQGGGDTPELNKTDHFAYISGYEDATFRPDTTIRRGEAAVIFARLIKDFDSSRTYTPSFADLTGDMYFYNHVGFLSGYGIITGYEDGTFRPWEPITRAEFAVIASKFAELTETEENVFTDVDDDFWGKPYILLAHKNGWVNGYEDGTFKPHASITRAEVVSIVNRMLERVCDTEFAENNADKLTIFGDITESHWAYKDILEAANGHLYITEDGGEVWTDLK